MAAEAHIFKFLRDVGGVSNMGTTAATYYWAPAEKKLAIIERATILLVDDVQTQTKFGGLAALTNGCKVRIADKDGVELYDYVDGLTLKMNAHWVYLAGPDNPVSSAAGDDVLEVRWTIGKSGHACHLFNQERLEFVVQDDLTGITEMRIMIQGYYG